ncbi:hypothetical protein FACS1894137_09770 [Spirochaetia bacterium]|nr:hypothetical protein FACS1894137_09770 [Spirochaetia bacterium]
MEESTKAVCDYIAHVNNGGGMATGSMKLSNQNITIIGTTTTFKSDVFIYKNYGSGALTVSISDDKIFENSKYAKFSSMCYSCLFDGACLKIQTKDNKTIVITP